MKEISKLIESQCRAWNTGDAALFSKNVSETCVFTNIFGQQFVGHDAFEMQHARIFETIYKGSRLEQSIDHMRAISPSVVIVDTSATVHRSESHIAGTGILKTRILQVFVREAETWQIASFDNVEERPFPGQATPA